MRSVAHVSVEGWFRDLVFRDRDAEVVTRLTPTGRLSAIGVDSGT